MEVKEQQYELKHQIPLKPVLKEHRAWCKAMEAKALAQILKERCS